jgi:hypothetical protein
MENRLTMDNLSPMDDNLSLPAFGAVSELVDFFDTHDMGDYAARMPEVHFEVAPNIEVGQANNGQFVA